jgi:hypothetical protein
MEVSSQLRAMVTLHIGKETPQGGSQSLSGHYAHEKKSLFPSSMQGLGDYIVWIRITSLFHPNLSKWHVVHIGENRNV